jgi:hypothetical protein
LGEITVPFWNAKSEEESLEYLYPTLAKEWHHIKNPMSPKDIKPEVNKLVWWICPNGHEYQSWVYYRTVRGRGCPFCSGRRLCEENCLNTVNPGLAQEWHPTKNNPLTPNQVFSHSNKKVWWVCSNGHEWEATICNRSNGTGCPQCPRKPKNLQKTLLAINPKLSQEWHPTKNNPLTPDQVLSHSHTKVWWVCSKGHEWKATICNRSNGSGCPFCFRSRKIKEK